MMKQAKNSRLFEIKGIGLLTGGPAFGIEIKGVPRPSPILRRAGCDAACGGRIYAA